MQDGAPPPAVAIITFGCRVNQADSLAVGRALARVGCAFSPVAAADVVVVNTCAVTAAAEQAARQAIRRLARERPGTRIVVTGCSGRRDPDALRRLPGVAAVVGAADAGDARWGEAAGLAQPRGDDGVARRLPSCGAGADGARPGFLDRTVATLSVQAGCDAACSFCVVPLTRGPARSAPLARVLEELRALEDAGYHEVILAGVHLGSWGRDLSPRSGLAHLLEAVARRPGALRIRLSSLEPMDVTPAVEDLIVGSPRFAPHVHLPLQHASDALLERMRRPYAFDRVAALFERLRRRMPDAALGTDLIAGFPGEAAADVERLVGWLARSPLSYVHVFPYSPRPGTAAAAFVPRVPGREVRIRVAAIRAAGARLQAGFRRSQVGHRRNAITLGDGTIALTDNYLKVRIPPGHARNARIRVRVTMADPLEGIVVDG